MLHVHGKKSYTVPSHLSLKKKVTTNEMSFDIVTELVIWSYHKH